MHITHVGDRLVSLKARNHTHTQGLRLLIEPPEPERPTYNSVAEFDNPIARGWICITEPFYQLAYGRASVCLRARVWVGVRVDGMHALHATTTQPNTTHSRSVPSAPPFLSQRCFDAVIFVFIILAGAMVGVQTYPKFGCTAPTAQTTTGVEPDAFCRHSIAPNPPRTR